MLKKTVLYCTQLDLSPLIHIIVTGRRQQESTEIFRIGFSSEQIRIVAKGWLLAMAQSLQMTLDGRQLSLTLIADQY